MEKRWKRRSATTAHDGRTCWCTSSTCRGRRTEEEVGRSGGREGGRSGGREVGRSGGREVGRSGGREVGNSERAHRKMFGVPFRSSGPPVLRSSGPPVLR